MFQHFSMEEKGNVVRVDRSKDDRYIAKVTVFDASGEKHRITVPLRVPKTCTKLLDAVLEENEKYLPRVIVKEVWFEGETAKLFGEVHITVGYDFYVRHMKRFEKPLGRNVAGIDVNSDRLNLAILRPDGTLAETKTFWFREITARGFPKRKAWSIIGMKIHELLRYAYHHGVSVVALENPEVLGYLKFAWIKNGDRKHRNWNWKVATFRNSIIERIASKAPLYGLNVKFVNPKGTTNSKEHDEIMRKYGLDRHSASAVVIAMRVIQNGRK